MKNLWVPWVSNRFLTGRRGGRGRLVFLFAVILIGAGVATLNTILAVMNGLQQNYIRSIMEMGSYHMRLYPGEDGLPTEWNDFFETHPDVLTTFPFREGQTMLSGDRPRPAGALVRGLPEDILRQDEGMKPYLRMLDGNFQLSGNRVVLGTYLARNLGVFAGDTITALDLGGSGYSPSEVELVVAGIFSCGYNQYDATMAFVSLDTLEGFFGEAPSSLAVKLQNPERVDRLAQDLHEELPDTSFSTWKIDNRSFFGALRTEKVMMMLLLALIFVVVAVNIDHSLRRMAKERAEDLSLLKAFGASPRDVHRLFLRHGLVIGGSGAALGSLFGVLIGEHMDWIVDVLGRLRNSIEGLMGQDRIYHPTDGFFRSSEVMVGDVVVIFSIAVILSSIAAVRAASLAARSRPAEVLRSE
ncbi:MAG: ABC transporter permease [Spirochaetales bacterium]|nr:ABC transporter permease [Spirochaetales bacterium]